ncbi:MAG: methionyl-tRNA formyltransferase [Verrucomicrobiota bacterium]
MQIQEYREWSGRNIIDVSTPKELEVAIKEIEELRHIFFLHWSYIVPDDITSNYECICFHMTDLPFGRGGSPLQNLIARGHTTTMLTALRMVREIDAGPVYLKKPLKIDKGSALEIYKEAGALSCEMIEEILINAPSPIPQVGQETSFRRRTPEQSVITETKNLQMVHDHIRMLDAPGYPAAFIEINGLRIEFNNSKLLSDNTIEATAKISVISPPTS